MWKNVIKFIIPVVMKQAKETLTDLQDDTQSCDATVEQSKKAVKKQSMFTKLVRDDNNFSTINLFLVATTFVGILLLIIPMI